MTVRVRALHRRIVTVLYVTVFPDFWPANSIAYSITHPSQTFPRNHGHVSAGIRALTSTSSELMHVHDASVLLCSLQAMPLIADHEEE
jgi:hypothetical protein